MGKVKICRPKTLLSKGVLNLARNFIYFKPHNLSWKKGRIVWTEVKGIRNAMYSFIEDLAWTGLDFCGNVVWLSLLKCLGACLPSNYFLSRKKIKVSWILVDEDDDGFDLIQPSLIQQLKTILDQYPDDGQILKVRNVEGLRCRSEFWRILAFRFKTKWNSWIG